MRLKLTLLKHQDHTSDVEIVTDATASVGEVALQIARSEGSGVNWDGWEDGGKDRAFTFRVHAAGNAEGHRLDTLPPRRPLGETSLESGSYVSLVEVTDPAALGLIFGSGTAELAIIEGPDAGARFTVTEEGAIIGRGSAASISLSDQLVSKRHARVEVEDGEVSFIDLNSANGLLVDDLVVTRVRLGQGQTVTLGSSVVQVRSVTSPPQTDNLESKRQRAYSFTRSPRVESRFPGEKFEAPMPPAEEDPQPFPWLIMLAPLIMGVILYLATKSFLSVIFVSLSPLMILGNFLSTRNARKAKLKIQIRRFGEQLGQLREKLTAAAATEQQVRAEESPSTFEMVGDGERRGSLLWTRRPEHWNFLTVNLGTGTTWSRTEVQHRTNNDRFLPEFTAMIDDLVEEFKNIDGVPIVEQLTLAGGLGIVEQRTSGTEYAHSLLAQLTGMHSPGDLIVTAFVGPEKTAEFDWLKWLPHVTAAQDMLKVAPLTDGVGTGNQLLSQLEGLVDMRLAAQRAVEHERPPLRREGSIFGKGQTVGEGDQEEFTIPLPVCIVLVAGDLPVDHGRLIQLFERGSEAGVYPIWLEQQVDKLPAVCRTFVDITDLGNGIGQVGYVREGSHVNPVSVQTLTAERAGYFARALSPVIDSSIYNPDASDLPNSVSLLRLFGSDMATDPNAIIDKWRQTESIHHREPGDLVRRQRAGGLRALVGVSGADAMHLDLRSHGPHALVGGTTGSGKSEFLQAWVLGLAAEYSPDRVTFLFVDYKGGSAFADCVQLPHCVGLVTDLSPHLVRRALTSLRAEIHYREHLFNRKKAKDIIELERSGDPECPPTLILVIDEFAALATEIPEFVDGVVDVAQRGRSLGIHLIMATQRPAGVIKDNLRANTNLRIALRMADETDSVDVIGEAVAAHLDPSIPGRGVVKHGPGRLTTFQTGYAGGWTKDTQAAIDVQVTGLSFGRPQPWRPAIEPVKQAEHDSGPNDTSRLVSTIQGAAQQAEIPVPRRPWVDELAELYDLAKLPQRTDSKLLLAVTDDPEKQSQYPSYFEPDVWGNIAFFGAGGSGKTTALRTLAVSAGIVPRGGPVHVYGLDFAGGGLRMIEALPHVGAVIAGDDEERVQRLFDMLRNIIDERIERFAAVNASTIAEYRTATGQHDEPRILLLLDGMAAFRQEYEFATSSSGIFTRFQQILAEGRQVGVHTAVTADRPGSIAPAVMSALQMRVTLRLTDENDYMLLDVPAGALTNASPAGRAVIGGLESQLVVLGGSAITHSQSVEIERLAETLRSRQRVVPQPIQRLASEVSLAELQPAPAGSIPFGIASDDLGQVDIEVSGVFMVSGPPLSGRTTTLQTMVTSLELTLPGSPRYYFGSARSLLATLPVWTESAVTHDDGIALARALLDQAQVPATADHRIVLMVESVADFLSTGVDNELVPLIKALKRNGHFVIGESETSTWSQSWPLLMEFKSGRRGLALQPDQIEGDLLFRTAFPRIKRSDFPVGRGLLVEAGRARTVQGAMVTD